ncbi:MAG TPA: TIM barrel protein [Noviherbaspirillum sp.]|uniref:sugar phosphate isomerase/epimerase family protein n=1 Tax=Noviherbaspirillum sp. TaxID=1926288 RepID=UPI002B47F232|nr:TIM barrel protein [Noviherbaspirillum sp.]HJV86587.1 TIM barrel protein [Noviherbaspirillum sp.]
MMMPRPVLSLASGVVPEATPLQTVEAAAAAGFEAVGLWIEPSTWTAQTTREVRQAVRERGLSVLDAEVIWLRPGPANPDHLRVLDIAAELGAANVLVVSSDPDRDATVEKFAQLCEYARRSSLRVALEFGAFTDVPTLGAAAAILERAAQPNQALLVDALHLQRSGGLPSHLREVPASWFSYAQFCDVPLSGPAASDRGAIREEAVDRRVCPGEGELPLRDLLQALPAALPLSIEVRSKRLREAYPDLAERASVVRRMTRSWLESRVME